MDLPNQESPDYLRELIRKTRRLTDKRFGVAVVLAFPHEKNINVILEEKVAVLQVYWGECSGELVMKAHQSGVMIVPQVSVPVLNNVACPQLMIILE
jgi:NAD(P)H-dependent flavin oxidoreductase YrpB (nitropropane dioxygenase family)